jgi:hypothetical protein
MSSKSECSCCCELNYKLKCALNEASSLNLIIRLLCNELTSDRVQGSSATNSSMHKQDHEVSSHRNWIEVNSKLRSNLYSFKKRNNFASKSTCPNLKSLCSVD